MVITSATTKDGKHLPNTNKTMGYNICLVVIISAPEIRQQKAITSAKCNTSIAKNTTKTKVSIKLQDTPKLCHHPVLEMMKVNISLRPEEAMLETGESLSLFKT